MARLTRAYGIGKPFRDVFPVPVIGGRAPTSADTNYEDGQVWIRTSTNQVWIKTSTASGSATWSLAGPGASDVDTINSLPPTAGNIIVDGGTNITDVNAGSTVTLNLDAAITLATSVTTPLVTAAAATDIQITAPTGQDCIIKLGDNAAANKLSILDSDDAEVYSVDSNGVLTMAGLTVAGAFVSNGGTVTLGSDNAANAIIVGGGTSARAITIGQDAAAHTINIGQAAAGAIAIDTAAGVSIGAATASDFTLSGAGEDLTLSSGAGRVIVNGEEAATNAITLVSAAGGIDVNSALEINIDSSEAAVADAVRIVASAADGGIDIDAGTGGIAIDSTGAVSIAGAAASDLTVGGAGIDLTLESTLGRVIVNAEEAADNAITLLSAAGGLDVDVALQLNLTSSEVAVDAIVINASGGGVDITAATNDIDVVATAGSVNITAGESAADSIVITSSIGGIDILAAGAAAGEDIDIVATGSSVNIEATEADANAITVKASDAAGGIVVECGTNGLSLGANATAHTTTLGSTNTTSATVIQSGTGRTTFTGTVKEIDAEFLFSSGTDLTVTQSPVLQSNGTDGAAPTGATGDVNLMHLQDGCLMEQFILGAGQTIIAPRMTANGLNLALDQTDDEGAEYNFGAARNNSKHAYTIQTSAAFFIEAEIYVGDLSGCEPLWMGFRKVQANDADYTNYTDFYVLGINNATSATNVTVGGRLNSGGITLQDTTDAWGGDAASQTLKILVSAAGVITAEVGGVAVSAPLAQTFDNTDVVVPFIHFLHDTDLAGEVGLVSFKCGFQA